MSQTFKNICEKVIKKVSDLTKIQNFIKEIKETNRLKDFFEIAGKIPLIKDAFDELIALYEIVTQYDLLYNSSEIHKIIVSKLRNSYKNFNNHSKTEHFSIMKNKDEIFKELQEEILDACPDGIQINIEDYRTIRILFNIEKIAKFQINMLENIYLVMITSCTKSDKTFSDIDKKVSKMSDSDFIIFKVNNNLLKFLTNNIKKKDDFFVYHLVIEADGNYIISDPFTTNTISQFIRDRGSLEIETINPESGVKTEITKKAKKEDSVIVIFLYS